MTHQERIKKEAETYVTGIGDVYRKYASFYGYIAGATAEREQFKPVIDALEEIQRRIKRGKAASSYQLEMIRPIINKALEQWKGKEVNNG